MEKEILCVDIWGNTAFLTDDGAIHVAHDPDSPTRHVSKKLRDMFFTHGYKGIPHCDAVVKLVFSFDSQPISRLEEELDRRGARLAVAKVHKAAKRDLWDKLPGPLSNLIVGLYGVDYYSSGFSVWVNLNSQYSTSNQRMILRNWKMEMARWLRTAVAENKGAAYRKASQLISLSRITSWAIGDNNLAVYRFELQDRILNALSGEK